LRREDTYFDSSGAKGYWKGSYHRLIDEFDPTGVLVRQTAEDYNPANSSFYRQVSQPEWDEWKNYVGLKTRFENEEGKLATNPGLSFNATEVTFDLNGREITSWQSGWSVEDYGAPVWYRETSWYNTGVIRRTIEQAYNEQRKLLSVLKIKYPSRIEKEFSAKGDLARDFSSGYDEANYGYDSRELVYEEKDLKSVTYRRQDGTEVRNMRVMIAGINEGAQPKTLELKVGDQFLAANGVPVSSAFEWALARDFHGGYIEVLRDGERLRIDGFRDGKLGVDLADFGPGEH
jgi:hypothetical protein